MGDANRLPSFVPIHLRIRVRRRHARYRGGASSDISGDDVLRMGHRIHVPARTQTTQIGLAAPSVPARHLCQHVLLRHLAECRVVSERQLVGGYGARHIVHHRHDDCVYRPLHHRVQIPCPCDLRKQIRDGHDALPRGFELRRDLGDDGGIRRFRRRCVLHGLRSQ